MVFNLYPRVYPPQGEGLAGAQRLYKENQGEQSPLQGGEVRSLCSFNFILITRILSKAKDQRLHLLSSSFSCTLLSFSRVYLLFIVVSLV